MNRILFIKKLNALGDKLGSIQWKIYQKINQLPAITGPKTIMVSKLIQTYLNDNDDRSTAGYSIRYHPNDKLHL